MSPEEYAMVCDRILTGTMKYISTDKMRKVTIDKSYVDSQDQIYISAAISKSPITIVSTPAGAGKSKLIADRTNALLKSGVPASEIAVLSMNIAKAKQIAQSLPGTNSMTFSDFTHYIYAVNNPDHVLVDDDSFINTLRLYQQTPFRQTFLDKLSIVDPLDRTTLLTLFVNNHLDEIEAEIDALKRSSYTLESMVCQNRMYHYDNNPFDLSEIIINGVHNMPLPILCTILEYASRYGCRLYITGAQDETIYTFNMAYGRAMGMLSGYMSNLNVGVVNLEPTQMEDDIYNTLKMDGKASIDAANVKTASVTVRYIDNPKALLGQLLAPGPGYIDEKLNNHEQILILARSKNDIAELKNIVLEHYTALFPNLKTIDLTAFQAPIFLWGKVLTKYNKTIINAFPQGITKPELYGKLWEYLSLEIENAPSQNMKALYQSSKETLEQMAGTAWSQDDLIKRPVIARIQNIIDEEAMTIQNHNARMREDSSFNIESADIIFSTIHSSIDLRIDNVVIYFRNFTNEVDENLYKVALSRARKSEYIIFVNSDKFEVPVQYYLKHHLVQKKGN